MAVHFLQIPLLHLLKQIFNIWIMEYIENYFFFQI